MSAEDSWPDLGRRMVPNSGPSYNKLTRDAAMRDERLNDDGYVMPFPAPAPVPAWQHRAVTPEQQLNRRVGIPLAIGTGITFLVCGAGAVVGVIWALSW